MRFDEDRTFDRWRRRPLWPVALTILLATTMLRTAGPRPGDHPEVPTPPDSAGPESVEVAEPPAPERLGDPDEDEPDPDPLKPPCQPPHPAQPERPCPLREGS